MRRNILWFIVVVLAALLQTTWPDSLKIEGVIPDLTLVLVVYFAIAEGEERAMLTGLLGGVYQDVASSSVLGHHVICLVLVGYTVGRFSTRLVTEHPAIKAGLVFCAGIAHGILYTFIAYVQRPDLGLIYTIATSVVPSAFYSALVTPLAYYVLAWLFHRRELMEGGL